MSPSPDEPDSSSDAETRSAPPPPSSSARATAAEAQAVDEGWDEVEKILSEPPPPPDAAPVAAATIESPKETPRADEARIGAGGTAGSTPPRKHDVRAPRISRSTQDSPRYRAIEASRATEPRRLEEPRRDRGERAGGLPRRANGERRATRDARWIPGDAAPTGPISHADHGRPSDGERVQERPARTERAQERPARTERAQERPARTERAQERPARTERAQERPVRTEKVVEPASPEPATPARSVAEELRVLSAPRITTKVEKRRDKPQTAKEALVARAERNKKKPNRAERRGHKAPKERAEEPGEQARAEATSAKRRDTAKSPARKRADPESETASAPVAAAPTGVWHRIKRLFGAS